MLAGVESRRRMMCVHLSILRWLIDLTRPYTTPTPTHIHVPTDQSIDTTHTRTKVLGAPPAMRHWWENTEVRSLAVHLPPSHNTQGQQQPPPLSDLAALGLGGCEEEEDFEEEGNGF